MRYTLQKITNLVTGIAALIISANPDLKALEVSSILKRTTSKKLVCWAPADGYDLRKMINKQNSANF